jgi:hypothetical protein
MSRALIVTPEAEADLLEGFQSYEEKQPGLTRGLADQPWQCRDFYVEDIDGHILCFSEGTA